MADIRQNIWDKLVQPEITKVRADYNKQVEDIKKQIEESRLRAQQEARSYGEQTIANNIRSLEQINRPAIQAYQNNIRGIQDLLAGKAPSVSLSYPGVGSEFWRAGELDAENLNNMLRGNEKFLQDITNPDTLRRQAVQRIIESDPQNAFGGDYKYTSLISMGSFFPEAPEDFKKIEDRLKEEIYLQSLPQAEAYYVDPLNSQVQQLTKQFDSQIQNLSTAGNETELRERQKLYDYMQKRNNEFSTEIKTLQDKGEYTPELGEAIKAARDQEMNFLTGNQFGFTPQAYEQSRVLYDQTRQQNIQAVQQGLLAQQQAQPPLAEPTQQVQPPLAAQPVTQPTVTQPAQTQPVATQPQVTQPVVTPTPVAPQVTTPTQPVATPVAQQPILTQQQVQQLSQIPSSTFLSQGIPQNVQTQLAQTGAQPMATTLNPEMLPALRSAGGGGTSAIDPTLRPYLELGLRAAEQQFLQTQPQFFPGQTYVSPSQQTLDAFAAQEQIARAAPSSLQAAQESYMRGLGGLGATAQGAFLTGNPFQQAAIEAATRPIFQQYQEQTLPGIASGFSAAGRYGSGAMERAQGRASEAAGRAIGDVASNIAYSGYEAERGRQQQALTQQIAASQMAPQIYGQQFLPSQQLAQIGAAQEAISAQPLQEQMARFQFAQQAPVQQLQGFLSSIYGTPMAGSQYAPTPTTQTNRAANVLGLAALGGGVGSMIGGNLGGYSSTAIGAGLGALGGLLS
jgi:hypothetical protein